MASAAFTIPAEYNTIEHWKRWILRIEIMVTIVNYLIERTTTNKKIAPTIANSIKDQLAPSIETLAQSESFKFGNAILEDAGIIAQWEKFKALSLVILGPKKNRHSRGTSSMKLPLLGLLNACILQSFDNINKGLESILKDVFKGKANHKLAKHIQGLVGTTRHTAIESQAQKNIHLHIPGEDPDPEVPGRAVTPIDTSGPPMTFHHHHTSAPGGSPGSDPGLGSPSSLCSPRAQRWLHRRRELHHSSTTSAHGGAGLSPSQSPH